MFFPYKRARTAATMTTDPTPNIKHNVKLGRRQNGNYFFTVIVLQ